MEHVPLLASSSWILHPFPILPLVFIAVGKGLHLASYYLKNNYPSSLLSFTLFSFFLVPFFPSSPHPPWAVHCATLGN